MGLIRLILAICVVVSHVRDFVLNPVGVGLSATILPLNGNLAVAFFFVLSGYLISYALHNKYPTSLNGTYSFFKSRALRIYPLWWILYLFSVIVLGSGLVNWLTHPSVETISSFFLFGSDWILAFKTYPVMYDNHFPNGTGIGWSLASELSFYALSPFLLRSTAASVIVFLFSALIRFTFLFVNGNAYNDAWVAFCYCFFPSTILFFLIGHFARMLTPHLSFGVLISWVFACGSFLICLFTIGRPFDNAFLYAAVLLFAAALPCIFESSKNSRTLNAIGDLTYPLYLVHVTIIILSFDTRFRAVDVTQGAIGWIKSTLPAGDFCQGLAIELIYLSVCLSVAAAVHYLIEKPLRPRLAAVIDMIETSFSQLRNERIKAPKQAS